MRSRKERIRRRMTRGPFSGGLAGQFQLCGIASHCLGNMGKTVAGKQCLEACVDFSGESRSFKNKGAVDLNRSEEHTSELQSLMRISYAVFCLQTKKHHH